MSSARRHLLVSAAASLLALGCGAAAGPSTASGDATAPGAPSPFDRTGSATQSSSAPAGRATARPGPAMVTTARVDRAAGTVEVSVTVSGPAVVQGGCEPTLAVQLVDGAGHTVAPPAAPGGVRCLAIVDIPIAAGASRTFTASVPIPATRGTYAVRGDVRGGGAIPSATVSV